MSYSTTITSPVSLTSLSPNTVVSDLENALMQNIGDGLQAGPSASNGGLQQEMQLLTDLLNQSNSSETPPAQTGSSGPLTNSGDPPASNAPPATSSDPSTGSSNGTNKGIGKQEGKLESALEQNITDRLQNGQSPTNGNSLEKEMNLLIQLLGQGA